MLLTGVEQHARLAVLVRLLMRILHAPMGANFITPRNWPALHGDEASMTGAH